MWRLGCYVKQMKPIQFSTIYRLYIWGRRWIRMLLLILLDWCKHANTKVSGSKCILNRFWYILWRPKAFFVKMLTYNNGSHNKFGLYIFPIFLGLEFCIYWWFIVPNSKHIHAVLAMLWLFLFLFLVIQQAEVLLNFLMSVYCWVVLITLCWIGKVRLRLQFCWVVRLASGIPQNKTAPILMQ